MDDWSGGFGVADTEMVAVGVTLFFLAFFLAIYFRDIPLPAGIDVGLFVVILMVAGVLLISLGLLSKREPYRRRYDYGFG